MNIKNTGYPFNTFYCGCGIRETQYKEDCYFYHEVRDMCAIIPTCNYYSRLGYCPCNNCEKYFKKSETYETIKNIVDERENR